MLGKSAPFGLLKLLSNSLERLIHASPRGYLTFITTYLCSVPVTQLPQDVIREISSQGSSYFNDDKLASLETFALLEELQTRIKVFLPLLLKFEAVADEFIRSILSNVCYHFVF